jgi:hypothetical protein
MNLKFASARSFICIRKDAIQQIIANQNIIYWTRVRAMWPEITNTPSSCGIIDTQSARHVFAALIKDIAQNHGFDCSALETDGHLPMEMRLRIDGILITVTEQEDFPGCLLVTCEHGIIHEETKSQTVRKAMLQNMQFSRVKDPVFSIDERSGSLLKSEIISIQGLSSFDIYSNLKKIANEARQWCD